MNNKRRRRKGLVRKSEVIVLSIFVSSAILLLALTNSFGVLMKTLHLDPSLHFSLPFVKSAEQQSRYYSGEQVQISTSAKKNHAGQKLAYYHNWIGTIKKVKVKADSKQKPYYTYAVAFTNGKLLKDINEKDLSKTKKSKYEQGQVVRLKTSATAALNGSNLTHYRASAGKIDNVSYNHSNSAGGYKYDITFDEGGKVTNVQEKDLDSIYQVALKVDNSAAQNNEVLRQAFAYAKQHPGTILGLPSGYFKIGSSDPTKDYLTLTSDTELRGDNTTLLVEGAAHWFALATGPGATDGVKNFTMRNINFKASNLDKGDQFMLMANHGDNWRIINNSFTMVHKMGSHVFDLGGLQNSRFEGNQFTGYAPELLNATKLDANAKLHDYYAEVIQLDASNDRGIWDGGLLKMRDPQYAVHNKKQQISNNITIANNSFVPYINSQGQIKAYSGTIGQHSSDVGLIKIYNNIFSNSLVSRISGAKKSDTWLFKAIHLKTGDSHHVHDIYANSVS